jgi:hypothetical protein
VVLGFAVALSALWTTQFYPRQPGTGDLAYLFRLAFGSGMAASIILGSAAIQRADVTRHRAGMTRAYALALGASTQLFTLGHRLAPFSASASSPRTSCWGPGWALNLLAAEFITRSGGNRASRATGKFRLS